MGKQEKGNARVFLPQADPPRKKTLVFQDMSSPLGPTKKEHLKDDSRGNKKISKYDDFDN